MKRILSKIALYYGILLTPVFLLFLLPYPKEFAYHFIENDCYNHGAWIYDRIVKNETPVDIAFIGSSHTIHAFQEKKMEEILGTGVHIANFGYCRYGRNLQYSILKLLLEHKTPQIIVIEVHEDEEKNSHDIFPYIADTRDLLLTPTWVNRDYFTDLFHGASARIDWFKTSLIYGGKKYSTDLNPYGYGDSQRTVLPEEWTDNREAWQRRFARLNSPDIEAIQLKYPLGYLEKMTQMIQERNSSLVFVYLPESGSGLAIPKQAVYYKSKGQLIIPPLNDLNDQQLWMDASHLNDYGSEILSRWMAEKLKAGFCLEPNKNQKK